MGGFEGFEIAGCNRGFGVNEVGCCGFGYEVCSDLGRENPGEMFAGIEIEEVEVAVEGMSRHLSASRRADGLEEEDRFRGMV